MDPRTALRRSVWLVLVLLACAGTALAQEPGGGGGGHTDPVGPILLQLVIILAAAKAFGALFLRFGQPAVLGELVAGVVLGNLVLLAGHSPETAAQAGGLVGWWGGFVHDTITPGTPLDVMARLGLVLLLFMVGLESSLSALLRVGVSSLLVSSIGVVAPFLLGALGSWLLLPGQHDPLVHLFMGATLCATSVGITARVFQELGRLDQDEARIVLGAAVADDVMSLIVLAVVTGVIGAKATGTELAWGEVLLIVVLAGGFLVASLAGGVWLMPRAFALTARLRGEGVLLITALCLCFVLSGVAGLIGLAPIVGAFAAGLLLEEVHYVDFHERHAGEHKIEDLLRPLAEFLVPLFFVQIGMTVRLATLADPRTLAFAAVLVGVAIAGKQACGLVVKSGMDRLSIGIGMIPRGEVSLIFAAIGRQLRLDGQPVISDMANSAIVIMVIATTMVAPGLLQWSLRRGDRQRLAAEEAG